MTPLHLFINWLIKTIRMINRMTKSVQRLLFPFLDKSWRPQPAMSINSVVLTHLTLQRISEWLVVCLIKLISCPIDFKVVIQNVLCALLWRCWEWNSHSWNLDSCFESLNENFKVREKQFSSLWWQCFYAFLEFTMKMIHVCILYKQSIFSNINSLNWEVAWINSSFTQLLYPMLKTVQSCKVWRIRLTCYLIL